MNLNNLDNIKVPKDDIENIKNSLYPKKRKGFKLSYAPIALVFCFIIGFAFPAYTGSLPVYRNIFHMLGRDDYQAASKNFNEVCEANGVKITLADAIYSDKSIITSFLIEAEEDLGELGENVNPMVYTKFKNARNNALYESLYFTPVGKNAYIGRINQTADFKKENISPLKVKYTIDEIKFTGKNSKTKVVKGPWVFNIRLDQLDKNQYALAKTMDKNGIYAQIDTVILDNLGAVFNLKYWNNKGILPYAFTIHDISLIDEEGETKGFEDGGGMSDSKIFKIQYRTSKKLELDEPYTLKIEFTKSGGEYYSAPADGSAPAKKYTESYVYNKDFISTPDPTVIEIPFTLKSK
ncbi:DUF4179 domain-containing protein [Peptoniphilus catoniae]|uniref:DUF4179 domain-containing protein n=1 Tax=Peptoniphilus catoniae TaxID=1660341 RepID=UPI0010FD4014|nr:DUF4179 domain-containing protein [Peptoniphilus catoniae]